jgi:hypothetical protein
LLSAQPGQSGLHHAQCHACCASQSVFAVCSIRRVI